MLFIIIKAVFVVEKWCFWLFNKMLNALKSDNMSVSEGHFLLNSINVLKI